MPSLAPASPSMSLPAAPPPAEPSQLADLPCPPSRGEMGGLLTRAMAKATLLGSAPTITALLASPRISGRGVLHVVVLDPLRHAGDGSDGPRILYEHSFGSRAHWDVDYAQYAYLKAELSWRHRMDSRQLLFMEPHRLRAGDSLLWGSVWFKGLVVAASGAFPIWDECFSLMVAAQLRARAWTASDALQAGRELELDPGEKE